MEQYSLTNDQVNDLDSAKMRMSDSEIQSALDGFFGEDVEPTPLDDRVKLLLHQIDQEVQQSGAMTNAQTICRWLFAELKTVSTTSSLEVFHPVIDQMATELEDFVSYAALLREYAKQRKKDLEYLAIDIEVNLSGEAYAELCEREPDNLLKRRQYFDKMMKKYTLGEDNKSWVNDVGIDVLRTLVKEDQILKDLEKRERASSRLKRALSAEGIDLKEELDQMEHYRDVNQLLKKTKKFAALSDADRDYLLIYAHDRSQHLYQENAFDLEEYFSAQFRYLTRDKKNAAWLKELKGVSEAFREACQVNPVFKEQFSQKWVGHFKNLQMSPRETSSCTRTLLLMTLAGSLTLFATVDYWKPHVQSFLRSQSLLPKIQKTDTAPVGSQTRQEIEKDD